MYYHNHVLDRTECIIRMQDRRSQSAQDWKVRRLGKNIEGAWIEDKGLCRGGQARWFAVGFSVYCIIKEMGLKSKSLKRTTKAFSEAAEKASSWIWSRRNKTQLNKAEFQINFALNLAENGIFPDTKLLRVTCYESVFKKKKKKIRVFSLPWVQISAEAQKF